MRDHPSFVITFLWHERWSHRRGVTVFNASDYSGLMVVEGPLYIASGDTAGIMVVVNQSANQTVNRM